MNHVIEIKNLTRDYGNHKGIFDVNINVKKGEVFGFLGPNGAGKTTTIRHLMGFIRAKEGNCTINGMDCFTKSPQIQKTLGYLAGEIAFPSDLPGVKLIDFIAAMKGISNNNRISELLNRFELDPQSKIKKMSKGMKQKVGIICAFMNDPEVIILDEPTSGLDPLMQNRFIELIMEEKAKGKTILMSSHIFEEVEKTCDRTAIIRNGNIVAIEDMESLKKKKQKEYMITFSTKEATKGFEATHCELLDLANKMVTVKLTGRLPEFLEHISHYPITALDIRTQSLEEIFMHYYGGEK